MKVPELYGLLNTQYELRRLDKVLEGRESFAIKPSRGSGGNGILVIQRKFGERYYKVDGSVYSLADIKYHCSKIISGMYSLGGLPDKAIIEACVEFDPVFFAYQLSGRAGYSDHCFPRCSGYVHGAFANKGVGRQSESAPGGFRCRGGYSNRKNRTGCLEERAYYGTPGYAA